MVVGVFLVYAMILMLSVWPIRAFYRLSDYYLASHRGKLSRFGFSLLPMLGAIILLSFWWGLIRPFYESGLAKSYELLIFILSIPALQIAIYLLMKTRSQVPKHSQQTSAPNSPAKGRKWTRLFPFIIFLAALFLTPADMFFGDLDFIAYITLIFIAPFLVIISAVFAAVEFLARRRFYLSLRVLNFTLLAVLSLLSIPGALFVRDMYRILSAKSYLEAKVPMIEAYMQRGGGYPTRVEDLGVVDETRPYLVAHHDGFSSCSNPPARSTKEGRWYCSMEDGQSFELSFGYSQGFDQRSSYRFSSKERVWRCSGAGCLTDHD